MERASASDVRVRIKICGFTRAEDLEAAIDAGVDLVGLNLIASSKRYVTPIKARELAGVVRGRVEVVGVVADQPTSALVALRDASGVDTLQLHGAEPVGCLHALGALDFKACRVAMASDLVEARKYRGPRLLLDAKVEGQLGGTGQTFDWRLIGGLAGERELLLAGGLRPENVARAVDLVRPWGVDTASGVETAPGIKSARRIEEFVEAARAG